MKDLGAALRFVRRARDLSQEDVSGATKIARSTISQIESGSARTANLTLGTVETLTRWIAGQK